METDEPRCIDCASPHAHMHNSRECQSWNGKIVFKRFPGYLCVECWKAANPVLFKSPWKAKPKKLDIKPYVVWFVLAILLAGIVSTLLRG